MFIRLNTGTEREMRGGGELGIELLKFARKQTQLPRIIKYWLRPAAEIKSGDGASAKHNLL
jgi:hypothetical protein